MDCNERESLKLIKLSNFEPKNENFYDRELEAFKKDLEEKHPVCNKCKSLVSRVLNKQALWLTCYKMLFFRQKAVKVITNVSTVARKLHIEIITNTYFPMLSLYLNMCLL